jgi:hypothetical protein
MFKAMTVVCAVALSLDVAGCGGGAGSATPQATHFELSMGPTSPLPSFPKAMAPGDHIVVTIQEQRCGFWIGANNQARPAGCDAPYPPHALAATVEPLQRGGPCSLTVTVISSSRLDVKKTGTGNPVINTPDPNGWCFVDLSDPATGAVGLTAY